MCLGWLGFLIFWLWDDAGVEVSPWLYPGSILLRGEIIVGAKMPIDC
jgi:hypothetical protein